MLQKPVERSEERPRVLRGLPGSPTGTDGVLPAVLCLARSGVGVLMERGHNADYGSGELHGDVKGNLLPN